VKSGKLLNMTGGQSIQQQTNQLRMFHFNPLPGKRSAALLLLLFSLALISCNSVSDNTLINAGGLLLRHELDINYRDELGRYMRATPWTGTPASEGKLANDQMPDWARDQYVACVYWEDGFLTESTVAQPGPDLIRIRRGEGWGWVLLDKDLGFHVLETNLRWTVTEDGVETESVSKTFIDAWEDPDAS
jgi:hypothetical protein